MVLKKIGAKASFAHITALEDLGFANNIDRMKGGFYTGINVGWNSDIPFIPVDTTVNSCGVSVFKLITKIELSSFQERIETIDKLLNANGIKNNYNRGNHFIAICEDLQGCQYLILHAGGISPYYGLLDEAIDCGIVYKPKPGYYARIGYDVQVGKETGELGKPDRVWKESELYCAKFWIPLYKDETFRHYVEAKFAFEDQVLINASEDIMKLMEKEDADLSENTGIDPNVAASGEDEDYVDDED